MTSMWPVWLTDTVTPDLSRGIHYTLLWGLEGVVLRSVEGGRVPNVNEVKLRNRLAAAQLDVAAVDPGLFEAAPSERSIWMNDLERLVETARFCGRIGCRRIIAGALPGEVANAAREPLERAAERLAPLGVTLCIRNGDPGRGRAAELAELRQLVDRAEVQACWDPVYALTQAGESPEEGARALGADIGIVIVRDVVRQHDRWRTAPVGEGQVGWADVLAALAAAGYAGPLCLEFGESAPGQALRDATTLIRLIRDVQVTS